MDFVSRIINGIVEYFRQSRVELKKVIWPSRKDTVKYTLIVIGLSIVVAAFLGACDWLFFNVLRKFLF